MAKASPLQGDFSGGELTPLAYGHVGSEKYKKSAAKILNYVPVPQGGLVHRPGEYYVHNAKSGLVAPRLEDFKYSTEQAYIIEFGGTGHLVGEGYARFFRNHGIIKAVDAAGAPNSAAWNSGFTYVVNDLVLVGGVTYRAINRGGGLNQNKPPATEPLYWYPFEDHIYEIGTPYPDAIFPEVEFAQSADVLYAAHKTYPPIKIVRYSHTDWRISGITFLDGPYLNVNATTNKIGASAATGTVTVTADSTAGINNDVGFVVTDVGRYIRIKNGATWAYGIILSRTSSTVISVLVLLGDFPLLAAKTVSWRLGVWSYTTGFPAAVSFHEDRLFFGGATAFPQRVDGSMTGDYENFTPSSATDGSVANNHAVAYTLSSNDVNSIHWHRSHDKGLVAGTPGGEWVIRPASTGEALSPTNVNAKQVTAHGSAKISPILVGSSIMFAQGSRKRLRAFGYDAQKEKFESPDSTLGFEHLLKYGITKLIRQREPFGIIWAISADGRLIGCSHTEDLSALSVAGHQHILGGKGYLDIGIAKVKSGACIPVADGSREELWLCVERDINGVTQRQIGYLTKFFDETDPQRNAFFVDAGLTYDSPLNIVSFIGTSPVEVFYTAHGLVTGDKVRINTSFELSELDDKVKTVTRIDANNFSIDGVDGGLIQNNLYGAQIRKLVTVISGLGHLEGQEVAILTDGSVHPSKTVLSASITLDYGAALVHIGLQRNADGQLLRLEAGSQDGTALGKKRRSHETGILVHRSLNLLLGMGFDEMDRVIFRSPSNAMSQAPPLYSGIITENIEADYDTENLISWRQDQPLPSTILAIMPQVSTQDKG